MSEPTTVPASPSEEPTPELNGKALVDEISSADPPIPEGGVKMFVGNLSYDYTLEDLNNLFAEFNPLHCRIVKYVSGEKVGTSRGYSFVIFSNDTDARRAIAELHQLPLADRRLNLQYAREAPRRSRAAPAARGRTGGRVRRGLKTRPKKQKRSRPRESQEFSSDTAHISNLSFSATTENVKTYFSNFGLKVEQVVIAKYSRTAKSRGFAFVRFASEADRDSAIEKANGNTFMDRAIRVKPSHKRDTLEDSPTQFQKKQGVNSEAPSSTSESLSPNSSFTTEAVVTTQ